MASVWLSQGAAVQGGAVGPMILGSTAVPTYGLLFQACALPSGLGAPGVLAGCTLASWLGAAALVSVPAGALLWALQRRQKGGGQAAGDGVELVRADAADQGPGGEAEPVPVVAGAGATN